MSDTRLQGKIAVVTGSDSGIGQGAAIEMAKEGADIVVHYLTDKAGAEHTKSEVENVGRRAVVVQADLTQESAVERVFDEALAAFGTVDILMNCAGVDASGTEVADLDTEVFEHAMRINVNNIGPGMVLTPFNQKAIDDPKFLEEQVQSIPMKRAAEPFEIGRLAVFLASADAAYVTGSTYYMDGGLMQNQGQGA